MIFQSPQSGLTLGRYEEWVRPRPHTVADPEVGEPEIEAAKGGSFSTKGLISGRRV